MNSSGRDEYALKVGGYLQQMEKFSTYFGLNLGHLVFSVTECLLCTLKGKETTVKEARKDALLPERYLRKLRNEEETNKFRELQSSKHLTDQPLLHRKRKLPRRVNDGADPHRNLCPIDFYRKQ